MKRRDVFALCCLVGFIGLMCTGVTLLREFGNPKIVQREAEPIQPLMDDYIILHAQEETGSNNAVTSVVFDYRGFDTLGEATVLFAAVVGVVIVFRREIHE